MYLRDKPGLLALAGALALAATIVIVVHFISNSSAIAMVRVEVNPSAVSDSAIASPSTVVAATNPTEVELPDASLPEPGMPPETAHPSVGMPTTVLTEGEILPGDSLASAMERENVPSPVVHKVTTAASKVFDFRKSRPGHRFALTQDLDGRVLDFRYHTSPTQNVHVFLDDDRYVTRNESATLTAKLSRVAGVVSSSLYGAIVELGEDAQLANDFTDVFAWDVDFARTTRPGDEFKVLYERLYYTADTGEEVYAGPGRILAARYGGEAGEFTAVYFESEEGRGGYYRPDGSSVERQFLMAPLRYTRITSGFTNARRHPILKITRPHHGIDYAAKHGSPVWSVARGEVVYRGWAGGFGNLVKVRHDDGYVSYYSHLSRFDKIKVGDRVEQKQVIGYVGQTGLATGPHTCFRVAKNGSYVNPARILSPTAAPISDDTRPRFVATRDKVLSELDAGPFVATGEAL